MQEVYDGLLSDINTFKASGAHVVCLGDYNAHVGSLDDRVLDPSGQPFGVASRRGSDPHAVNASGQSLVNLCLTTGTLLCTGRSAGGAGAVSVLSSFVARAAQTRPDHCLVSTGMMSRVLDPVIHSDIHGSDHKPLSIGLALSSSATSQSPAVPAPSEQLFRLAWDDDRRREFFSALELDDVVLDLLAQAQAATLSSDTLGLSVQLLGQALFHAARVVGMKIAVVSASCRRKKVHQPWFDDECKAAVRALGTAATSQQTQQLRSLYQRKKRQYAAQQYSQFEANEQGKSDRQAVRFAASAKRSVRRRLRAQIRTPAVHLSLSAPLRTYRLSRLAPRSHRMPSHPQRPAQHPPWTPCHVG